MWLITLRDQIISLRIYYLPKNLIKPTEYQDSNNAPSMKVNKKKIIWIKYIDELRSWWQNLIYT